MDPQDKYAEKASFFRRKCHQFFDTYFSRKKGLTYRVRVRIVTTTQNGTEHKELGLSAAVESSPGIGGLSSSRLGSCQSRSGTRKSIDGEYKTKE